MFILCKIWGLRIRYYFWLYKFKIFYGYYLLVVISDSNLIVYKLGIVDLSLFKLWGYVWVLRYEKKNFKKLK